MQYSLPEWRDAEKRVIDKIEILRKDGSVVMKGLEITVFDALADELDLSYSWKDRGSDVFADTEVELTATPKR